MSADKPPTPNTRRNGIVYSVCNHIFKTNKYLEYKRGDQLIH